VITPSVGQDRLIAALLYATRVAARTLAVELLPPFHHIAFAAVFGDELLHLIAALAAAFGAFDAQRGEFAGDITADYVRSLVRAYLISSSATALLLSLTITLQSRQLLSLQAFPLCA